LSVSFTALVIAACHLFPRPLLDSIWAGPRPADHPAVTALRWNPTIRAVRARLQAAGKPTMVIIGAAMRKLIHIAYGVLKSKKAYEPRWSHS
jgi:transposase